MKTFLLSLLVVLLFSFSNLKQSSVQSYNNGSGKFSLPECPVPPTIAETINNDHMNEKQEKSPESIDQDWYGKAIKNIQDEEYVITYSNELGEYQSPNRKNNIRFAVRMENGVREMLKPPGLGISRDSRQMISCVPTGSTWFRVSSLDWMSIEPLLSRSILKE